MLISYCDTRNQFEELELREQGGTIGYNERNFIVLDEDGVSAVHCRLTAEDGRLFLEDLNSLNGTYINGRALEEKTEVKEGDIVWIGLVLFRFSRNDDSWSASASRLDKAFFMGDRTALPTEEEEPGAATAVTVIAAGNVKAALEAGNIEELQDSGQPSVISVQSGNFTVDSLQELGKYKLLKKIGKGGMGVVFLARHKVMNTYRALKVLPLSVREERYDFFERFMREARIASEIRHPNIVGVMDAETDLNRQAAYIVMEFIDGGTLRRILKIRKTLPEVQALLIVKSVAEALQAIAAHKIIHRDIKPDNIMFTRHGEVKLADLGIAKNEEEDVSLTRNDIMIGTPAYLSPEQIEDPKTVDIRSDIYSLGATLYEMLTGAPPYAGKTTYDILQKMIAETIVDPRKKNPHVSAVTARIVMKMLHKNPARRYQTPAALLKVLNSILQRYSAADIQGIMRSAILGTDLPQGVRPRVAAGIGAGIHFAFFCFRQRIAGIFSRSPEDVAALGKEDVSGARFFSFQLESGAESAKNADFSISVVPGKAYKVVSLSGYSMEQVSSADGKLELTNLPPGEYRVMLHGDDL